MDNSQTPGTDSKVGSQQRIASRIVLGRVTAIQPDSRRQQRLAGAVVLGVGVLALFVPLWPELAPERRLGLTLLAISGIELFHGFRRADAAEQRSAWFGGLISLALAILLMNAPMLVGGALKYLVAGWFAVDGVRYAVEAFRARRTREPVGSSSAAALGYFVLVLLVLLVGRHRPLWAMAIAVALRCGHTAANIFRASILQADDAGERAMRLLGLEAQPEVRAICDRLASEESARKPVDRYWILTFVLTLFAIHLGRMGFDGTAVGILAPGFAVVGDLSVALGMGLFIVIPTHLAVRHLTRPVERQAWRWCLSGGANDRNSWMRRLMRIWLTHRLRFAIRVRQASYTLRSALGRGLQIGLPVAAILAATTPVWGMSWYFDTENYASGIWDSWAEARTDTWRKAMIHAVEARETAAGRPAPTFAVSPPGNSSAADFSFLVIGDTGEGDASQHVLRDQLILAALQPEVRFVVLSSDVVYPSGEMKDYEARFWLPFKGVDKPVYAIPGNHDWYDALEGFAATFFEPDATRTTMRARVAADFRITKTTDRHIETLIAQAARLRQEYRVPTGFQQGPFFQFQTDRFALFAVDTGVRMRLDEAQLAWLKAALASARGKFKMAILGHPLFACGEYRAGANADFAALHQLLREHEVRVVMAGDTHDLEYYGETADPSALMYHFVNGGGGAFLTMGAQFAPLEKFPTRDWAFYPAAAPLIAKIEANNASWKKPMWWWTKHLRAWPSSPEWLSAAFDYNVAPFFQSFFEIRVEPTANRVQLLPWGVHGRLRWSDLQMSAGLRPPEQSPDALVEWVLPMEPVVAN
ncbi:MAG TPA: metallophosphoesterase [Phycisphaerae bacterium]|nr:metallophosphoesterase [Phycisphaerae bacterium]